jgi:predicted component of type VI protein secretion system
MNTSMQKKKILFIYFWGFNATFSNISAISWRPVLVVDEAERTTNHG